MTLTLSDFLDTDYWMAWDSDNRNSNIMLSDPDRYSRMMDAAEDGADGSTHAEIIEDFRAAIHNAYMDDIITEAEYYALDSDISAVEEWHIENGSIDMEVGY